MPRKPVSPPRKSVKVQKQPIRKTTQKVIQKAQKSNVPVANRKSVVPPKAWKMTIKTKSVAAKVKGAFKSKRARKW